MAESAILAALLVACLFLGQGWTGFSLWDEGFLWYGVQRVAAGEVPIRDFMAYDPGRYYWTAAFSALLGDHGIVAVRLSAAVFQWLALAAGLYLLRREGSNDRLVWLLASLTLAVWMFPRHKLFDIGVCVVLVLTLTLLVARPCARRYFLAGFAVGLAAVFGRNHGLYGAVALGMVVLYLWVFAQPRSWLEGLRSVVWSGLGIIAGYSPVLMMLIFVPGFAPAFLDSILFLLQINATNLNLPVPWPWRVDIGALSAVEALREVLLGATFLGLAIFAVAAPAMIVLSRWRGRSATPFQIATAALAAPYAHFAFSRADVAHLAQGIFPTLLGLLFLISTAPPKSRRIGVAILCCISFAVMLPRHPAWSCSVAGRCVATAIGDDTLRVPRSTAADISLLQSLADRTNQPDRPVLALPFWPGANAVLAQKAPVWAIYALFPRSEAFQRAEIARIKSAAPRYAVLIDWPLDGRDALRFRNTNPLIHGYITEHFRRLPEDPRRSHLQLYEAP